eukprot:COSAG03_NODE_24292_length_273_cov_0.885057_1_plen_43_part_01
MWRFVPLGAPRAALSGPPFCGAFGAGSAKWGKGSRVVFLKEIL